MTENQHGAKYAFYYLLSLVSLIFIGISVGLIAFGIIDQTIIDPLIYNYYNNRDSSFRFAISALLIATPIYYYSLLLINRGFKLKELEKDSSIRKWLTYFIILVSVLIILGVFISVINNFLAGGLSWKFFFQSLSMLIISGLVFSYYFYDIRNAEMKKKAQRCFFISSLVIILASFVTAFFFVESPQEARNRRLDDMLLNRIYSLESIVNEYYLENNQLPESIDDLKNLKGNVVYRSDINNFLDPETGEEIEYHKLSELDFEFCATFRTDSEETNSYQGGVKYYGGPNPHSRGYSCQPGNLWEDMQRLKMDNSLETVEVETIEVVQ